MPKAETAGETPAHPCCEPSGSLVPRVAFLSDVFHEVNGAALTCRQLAATALQEWHGLHPSVPVPAGGMTTDRVPELLEFYGSEVIMLLIGGNLLEAREQLVQATSAFVAKVHGHRYP